MRAVTKSLGNAFLFSKNAFVFMQKDSGWPLKLCIFRIYDELSVIFLKILDDILITSENQKMIEVMRLDGTVYWVNPHMIESMESNPDLTLTGKKVVLKTSPTEIIERIVAYRKKIGNNAQEVL